MTETLPETKSQEVLEREATVALRSLYETLPQDLADILPDEP